MNRKSVLGNEMPNITMDIHDSTARPEPVSDVMTYDDILNILNVRMTEGKLEAIAQQQQQPTTRQQQQQPFGQRQQQQQPTTMQQKPTLQRQHPGKPMTREEYKTYVMRKQAEAHYQRMRIREIKSTKLQLLDQNNTNTIVASRTTNELNRLFGIKK